MNGQKKYAKTQRETICKYIEKTDRLDLLRFIFRMEMNLTDNSRKGGAAV